VEEGENNFGYTCDEDCPPKWYIAYKDGLGCDICRKRFKKGDRMFGCRTCNWDCCENCMKFGKGKV